MNNYNDREIEVMSDDDLKQFLAIVNKMLERDSKHQTKLKIELDQATTYRDELSAKYEKYLDFITDDDDEYRFDYEDMEPPCNTDEIRAMNKKVERLQFKLKELSHKLFYLQRTLGRAKAEVNARSGIKGKVSSLIDDIFGEE